MTRVHSGRPAHTRRAVSLAAVVASVALVLSGCAGRPSGPSATIVMWTTLADQSRLQAQQDVIDAFEDRNPGLHVRLVPKPEQGGTGDTSTLLTAVRGGVQPDVSMMGRFPVSQYAALGLLQPLDRYIDRKPDGYMGRYNAGAVNETKFDHRQYAMPMVMDGRALFYNKTMLRQAGVDPSVLDPSHGAPTIDEVRKIGAAVDHRNAKGAYDRLGYIPWEGEGWALTYAIGNHATFFDDSRCRLTIDSDPGIRKAYQDFSDWADEMDFRKVDAFDASYSPPDGPPSQNAFLNGKLAMISSGNFQVASLEQYAPDIDYGITYLPVPESGQQPYSWSGGAGMVIPKGSTNGENAWKLIEFFTSITGQEIYAKGSGDLPSTTALADRLSAGQGQGFFSDVLRYTTSRVPIPVGSTLFDAMDTAQQSVLLGGSVDKALQDVQDQVQPQMQQYCPYDLPSDYRQGDRTR